MAINLDARLPRFSSQDGTHHNNDNGEASGSQVKPTMAQRVNALNVYEDAVQEPLLECSNLASMYYQAQPIGSRRPDAKILREDFCSSAIVAQTWLELGKDHRSQGVDIDLKALQVAQKRFMASGREDRNAKIVQSAQFSQTGKANTMTMIRTESKDLTKGSSELDCTVSSDSSTSTWAKGAASDRFERKFQAKLARESMKAARKSAVSSENVQPDENAAPIAKGDVMILQHADVLTLPIEGLDEAPIERPDLIYAGNYALSYFHDRKSLLAYLAQCKRTLRKRTGVLIVDPFAGPTNWEVKTESEFSEQEDLWKRFSSEPDFLRPGEKQTPSPLKGDPLEFWTSPSLSTTTTIEDSADWKQWPRGRLVLVRKGLVSEGEYEYWREDGPLDYTTNRFRMSLSFRFSSDGSWLRDYFSYDFRVWSLREITEAMEEVGFERVSVHAIPRTTESDRKEKESEPGQLSDSESEVSNEDDDDGLNGMANLMERTEKHEAEKSTYKVVESNHKLFATRSFGTYIIACMPFDEQDEQ